MKKHQAFIDFCNQYNIKIDDQLKSRLQTTNHQLMTHHFSCLQVNQSIIKKYKGIELNSDAIKIHLDELSSKEETDLRANLLKLKPWRKGPFELGQIKIKTEWESILKWNRLQLSEKEIKGKKILDIGANSGYYSLKCLPMNPKKIIAMDPYPVYFWQYHLINQFIKEDRIIYAPLKVQDIAQAEEIFDTILCLGILYHQQSPIELIKIMKKQLKKKGLMVIETLIWPGEDPISWTPKGTYAGMSNIYFLPTKTGLVQWLEKCNFKNIKILSITQTTTNEQRKTEWIDTYSLKDFLDPKNKNKTIEGAPAPSRIVIKANK